MRFLILEGSDLSIEGQSLTPAEKRTLQDGSTFEVYKVSGLQAGESIQLTLRGQPVRETGTGTLVKQNGGSTELGIGLGVLGLALAGAGIWWWRRRDDEETEEIREAPENTIEGILAEIHALDQAHERGELQEDEYQGNRTRLLEKLKIAVGSPTE